MSSKQLSTLIALCVLVVGLQRVGSAQQTTATLVGSITDPSGSSVADVEVVAENTETGARRIGRTDSLGNYSVPFLPAGIYKISTVAKGFRPHEVKDLVLSVGQTSRMDIKLELGDVTQSVSVQASAVELQTENSAVGTVIRSSQILELPLNGRNFVQLAQLVPGAQTGTPGSITVRRGRGSIAQSDSNGGSTGFSANGVRDTANRYFIDGIEFMDYDAMTYPFSPSVDSLAEFKVETSTYSAATGAAPGGQISVLTKSGTNRLHGTLWEFNRNNALTSTYDAIANKDLKSPRLNRNQFGGNLGGPVIIPKIYKGENKTFWFFNTETGRLLTGAVPGYAIVPTQAQRNGDLSGLTNNKGVPIVLKDPLNIGITGNVIPKAFLSPQALAFLQYEPLPNTLNGVFNFISTPQNAVSTQDNYLGRVDHNFSSRDMLTARFLFDDSFQAGTPFWGHDTRSNFARTQNLSTSETHTFTPFMINDFRFGYHRMRETEIWGTTFDPAYDVAGKMGYPLASTRPIDYGPPSIRVSGPDGSESMYNLQRQIGPRARIYQLWQGSNGLSIQKGKHSLQIGAEIDRRNWYFNQARNPRGDFRFNGIYTGSALGDFLLGYLQQSSINPTPTTTDMWNWWQAYYVNDEWKVTPNLTLTLGLRYDYFQRWVQSDDQIVDIYQNGFLLGDVVTPKNSPYGRSLLQPDRNNWGPRFGFAYRPHFIAETVVRGGYGIYYQPEHPNANFSMIEGAQATSGITKRGATSGTPNLFWNNPFSGSQSVGQLNFATSIDQNYRDAYVQQWNLTIQHKFPGDIIWDVGYVGSKGTHLSIAFDSDAFAFNRPIQLVDPRNPAYDDIDSRRPDPAFPRQVEGTKSIGNSIYHSLQTRLEKRMSHGLTFLTSYTWSKVISGPHDQGSLVGNGNYIGIPQDYYNLRNERAVAAFDVTQRFVSSVVYDIPLFRNTAGIRRTLLGGWQTAAIVSAQSGFPAGLDYGIDSTGTGQDSRPDLVAGQNPNLPADQRTWQRWFNPAAFTAPQWGQFGTSPRSGAVRLPGLVNTDFSFTKEFWAGERLHVDFRTEFFNLFNHFNPSPGSVDLDPQSKTFGSIGGGVQGVTTRVVQLGAKLVF